MRKTEERKETPQERYHKKNLKVYRLPCMKSTETDIINKLDSEPNKSGYIKQLIRQNIAQEKNDVVKD
ncbi:MAG: hypothetical protein RSA24_05950 [Clostridia bacterium]